MAEETEENNEDSIASSVQTGVNVDVNAETRATVIAPVLVGNTITGSVTVNCNLSPARNDLTAGVSSAAPHDYRDPNLRLKNKLKQDYERILVGNSNTGHQKYLNNIYTDLYVVENKTGGRVNDHEIRQMEKNLKESDFEDTPIQCNNIFKVHMGRRNRKVLTMGIAGIGKTVSVSKFILDWAEGNENQDIDFIFPLPFRRLNLINEQYSLIGLINKDFFSKPEELASLPEGDGKVMFIFDGLDECRFSLNFNEDDRFTNVNEKTSVSKIITNLIKNHLVPSALVWITSRPAAASLVPRNYINQVTEVRGFNNEQKEQYFKNNSSAQVAENIICHIKKSRTLYIMCHIPVFCWISLTVLQPLLAQESDKPTPTTLTGMYTSFLLTQQQQMEIKYSDEPKPSAETLNFDKIILNLGKLAFGQLQKGNLIFYKKDLEECGLSINEISVYSGLCTQIFQAESAFSKTKVYSFVHLSVQEFLAALHVFFVNKDKNANPFLERWKTLTCKLSRKPLFELHKSAVKKTLQSENGHLDLFLQFLMGLSLESNQRDLRELLPGLELKPENLKDTTDYIKKKIEKEESTEKTINLFHCLSELKDDFVEEIQKNLSSGNLSAQSLSSAQWSGLAFVLLVLEETKEKFEMQKYRRSDEALMRLLPVIKYTRRALLQCCHLTALSCEWLSSALQSSNFSLRELDLSNNDLQDSGVRLLSIGLKSTNCQLETLRLSGCMVTEEGCGYVSSALSSTPSHLRELDLSYNNPGDSGVKLLSEKLKDPTCSLHKLNVDHGGKLRITAGVKKWACFLRLDPNTAYSKLSLSEENRRVTHVEEFQPYPDHPLRFNYFPQVLCGESVCGRCYWETEWSGEYDVFISVSYKSISRKRRSDKCWLGYNDQSWSLICSPESYSFRHNDTHVDLPEKPIKFSNSGVNGESVCRTGVYVDHSSGTLSFYSIDRNTMSLIHSVQTTFTQPLYPGFWIDKRSSVKLC